MCNCLFVCTCVDSFLCSGCCAGTGGPSLCSQTILSPVFRFQDSGNQVPVLVVTKSHFILDYSFSKSWLSSESFPYGSDPFLGMPSMLQPLRGLQFPSFPRDLCSQDTLYLLCAPHGCRKKLDLLTNVMSCDRDARIRLGRVSGERHGFTWLSGIDLEEIVRLLFIYIYTYILVCACVCLCVCSCVDRIEPRYWAATLSLS